MAIVVFLVLIGLCFWLKKVMMTGSNVEGLPPPPPPPPPLEGPGEVDPKTLQEKKDLIQ